MKKQLTKGEIKRQQILSSAERLFCMHGYDNTTIDMILAELGCTKGSFYHHFTGKPHVLEEIANDRVRRSFERYKAQNYADNIAKLNGLLYHASPFQMQETEFLSVLMSLIIKKEFADIFYVVKLEGKKLFFDELIALLQALKDEEKAYWREEEIPSLLWEVHMGFILNCLIEVVDSFSGDESLENILFPQLSASRFMWQRLLDLPYGAIYISELSELVKIYERAFASLNSMFPPHGLNIQTVIKPSRKGITP
jgi:AcrR family transcriptional regulator